MNLPHSFPAAIIRLFSALLLTHPGGRDARRYAIFRLFTALLLTGGLTLSGLAAEAVKSFNVPAGDAIATLKQAAQQAGMEIMFPAATVQGVKTAAVNGELTPRAALDKMLDGTGLVAVQDEKTGALAVKKGPLPNAPRVAQTAATPESQSKVEDGKLVLDTFEVTGSRIRLNSGERPVQPVLTFTSQDMERLGMTDLGQLFQYIPSVTSSTAGLGSELANGSTLGGAVAQITARTTANLRGGTETSTLLLVDGKRVPITARRNAGGNGYDLGGIPLSAIDRVEVLLDGASSIYGADAIYGVINVILKKRYSGTEIKLSYDNTFDGDAGIKTASLTHGFSAGKLSGLITFSATENNIMLLTDRALTATYNRTLLGGTTDASTPTLYIQGAGVVNVASGNLPGITPATPRASLPNNTTGAAALVGDFASAPTPIGGNVPDRQGYTSYVRQKNGYARFKYEFKEWLEVTAMARLGANRMSDNGQYRRMENVTIPVGYPGNPFTSAVRLSKIFYDLPLVYSVTETRNNEFALSATGKLPGDWRYEAAINYVRGENNMIPAKAADGSILSATITAATVAARITAASAAGRKPPLIYDSRTQSPNAAGVLDEFWVNTAPTVLRDLNENWTYSAQADGKLFTLPAGDIRVLLGTEIREEYLAFPNAIGGAVWGAIPQRDVTSFFAEAKVPIFSPKQKRPLLNQLGLNFAGRKEKYSDVGGATTPRYGVVWRPIQSVLFRGSFGEGFLVPPLYRTAAVLTQVTLPWSALASTAADPLRGNTVNPGNVVVTSGGNPNLRPQRSEHLTYGVIIDVPEVKGLSVSLDWFDNKYTDNLGSIGAVTDRVLLAPDTITRGPNLPTDLSGWAGPIIAYDARVINIASARTAGYNFGVRWNQTTNWGELTFTSSGEKILRDEQRVLPTSPRTATVDKIYRPMRITTSLFWAHRGWDVGATSVYGGEYWVDTSNATLAPSRYTESVMRWDFSAGYDLGRSQGFGAKGQAWWRRLLHDTKLRVTGINVFNTEPPLDVRGFYSSSVIDMRLRRYVVDLTKRF